MTGGEAVSNEGRQLGKRPLRIFPSIPFPCALRALANVRQLFQADEHSGCHQAIGRAVIDACFELSLSEGCLTQARRRPPSAFLLQALPHPLIAFPWCTVAPPARKSV